MTTRLKSAITVRGDSLYCPLPVSIDCYWNCVHDCHHCYFRRLNQVWGSDLRPADPEDIRRKLTNGLRNSSPSSSLAHALAQKKTLRLGNKSDPFQPPEKEWRVAGGVLEALLDLSWETVIQTRDSEMMMEYEGILRNGKDIFIFLPIVSPGYFRDWETFEKKSTTPPNVRLRHARYLQKRGLRVGVNGEPFIPGFHTVEEFEEMIRILKSFGIRSYNTYNFHFNGFVARRLAAIGVDIERIWYYNESDEHWKPIQQKLIDIAYSNNIVLGCPDFVNTGRYPQPCNTCCGVTVENPCTFNAHTWKNMVLKGYSKDTIFDKTWDGVGDQEQGKTALFGESDQFYTLKDAGL